MYFCDRDFKLSAWQFTTTRRWRVKQTTNDIVTMTECIYQKLPVICNTSNILALASIWDNQTKIRLKSKNLQRWWDLWQCDNMILPSGSILAESAVSCPVVAVIIHSVSRNLVRLMKWYTPFYRCWKKGICANKPTLFTGAMQWYELRRLLLFSFQGQRMDVDCLADCLRGQQAHGSGHPWDRWLPPPTLPHLQQLLRAVWHRLPQTWGGPDHRYQPNDKNTVCIRKDG